MTTASIAVITTLLTIIIGMLGFGGGKLWGDRKVSEKIAILNAQLVNRCNDLHDPCREARMIKEQTVAQAIDRLTSILKEQIQPRLIINNFIMDALAEEVGVPKEILEKIRKNVKNGSLTDI